MKFRITMNISSPLITMLQDPLLQHRYTIYLLERLRLASKEIRRTYCGTPVYLAPEMIKEIGHDEHLDIWCI